MKESSNGQSHPNSIQIHHDPLLPFWVEIWLNRKKWWHNRYAFAHPDPRNPSLMFALVFTTLSMHGIKTSIAPPVFAFAPPINNLQSAAGKYGTSLSPFPPPPPNPHRGEHGRQCGIPNNPHLRHRPRCLDVVMHGDVSDDHLQHQDGEPASWAITTLVCQRMQLSKAKGNKYGVGKGS